VKRRALVVCGIAAVLVASLFAIPALAASRDGNGDRIPDRWEAKYHLSLNKNQAPRDQDKDGVNNLSEFKDGTSPRSADTDSDGTTDATDDHPCDHAPTSGETRAREPSPRKFIPNVVDAS
jgi:hypothetical protein